VFAFTETRGRVDVAFTDRHGGVSDGPYASLNLAVNGSEDPVAVEHNLDVLARAFAPDGTRATLALMRQVHGAEVAVVAERPAAEPPEADALVTGTPGVALVVRAADCVPVLLADVGRGVVGAAHAGRPGLVAGIVPATVAAMRDLGAGEITAWVGPHICGACYEVPEQMRADVAAVVPEAFAETSWGTPAVDVGAGVLAQLRADGVDVVDASRCTREDEDLYSYRRQGVESGRLAGVVRVRP
jgi:purine-nucleoside/S-methyl-5'-thioadenosine phosphorylase / adenosine deaminase